MIRALVLFLAFALPALAETAQVRSGEHGDFTRLVIDLDVARGWTLGRTGTGYAFATDAEVQPDYDLSRLWDLIPRTRLTEVKRDPRTGALTIELGCECHIFPFETRPGNVVLDIKPGPPPAASTFEYPFSMPGDVVPTAETTAGPGYDWLSDRTNDSTIVTIRTPQIPFPLPLETGSVSLEPLRDELLRQIARGAADGIVDMELPGKPKVDEGVDPEELPWSNIYIGEVPGAIVTDPDAFVEGARSEEVCPDPKLLDLPSWGGTKPAAEMLAEARTGLFGEFDEPQTDAIVRAVQLLLYLGFGAEAAQTADLVETPSDELKYYRSMGRIIDGEADPATPFATMLDCDGPASLWSALAQDRLPADKGVKRDSILQAFTALPAHLRQHLGPSLAEKFLARDDIEAARIVRDAMERAPQANEAAVALLDAKSDLRQDEAEAAQAHAETVVAMDGDGPEGLVTLVETHFRTLKPLGPETAEALRSLQGETAGTTKGPEIDRAVVLALALSDQLDAAFDEPAASGQVLDDLWRITQDRATDDAFLLKAILPARTAPPMVDPDLAQSIAERVLSLGFPDAALVWLGPVFPEDAPEKRRLAAKALVAQGDARSAVSMLAGLQDAEAESTRAQALIQLDDPATAAQALAASGDAEAAVRLSPWKQDWESLDPALPAPWLQAADTITAPADGPSTGLLGRGGQAVEASVASRAAIEALLTSVTSPPAD